MRQSVNLNKYNIMGETIVLWIIFFLIIGLFFRKVISKIIKFFFVPQQDTIEGEFIKSWIEPTIIPASPTIGVFGYENPIQWPTTIDGHFLSLKVKGGKEITLRISLFFSLTIEKNLKEGKKYFSFLCKKYKWEEEPDVVEILSTT